jgi:hypothetical protein
VKSSRMRHTLSHAASELTTRRTLARRNFLSLQKWKIFKNDVPSPTVTFCATSFFCETEHEPRTSPSQRKRNIKPRRRRLGSAVVACKFLRKNWDRIFTRDICRPSVRCWTVSMMGGESGTQPHRRVGVDHGRTQYPNRPSDAP